VTAEQLRNEGRWDEAVAAAADPFVRAHELAGAHGAPFFVPVAEAALARIP
jgi:hypothetical protein